MNVPLYKNLIISLTGNPDQTNQGIEFGLDLYSTQSLDFSLLNCYSKQENVLSAHSSFFS